MGAEQFRDTAKAKTAEEAFKKLVEEAQYDYGHAGYTGTIAEKPSFRQFTPPDGMTPGEFMYALELSDGDDEHIREAWECYDDKWGPAVCVQEDEDTWTFLGLASS
jgi:hypothetical protein